MFTEDFTAFFSESDFAKTATLGLVEVRGIFDADYAQQQFGPGVSANEPVFVLPTGYVPINVIGMSFVIDSAVYKVVEHMPDGTGVSRLRLRA